MLRCNFATEGDRLANNEAPHPPTMIEVVYDFVFAGEAKFKAVTDAVE